MIIFILISKRVSLKFNLIAYSDVGWLERQFLQQDGANVKEKTVGFFASRDDHLKKECWTRKKIVQKGVFNLSP